MVFKILNIDYCSKFGVCKLFIYLKEVSYDQQGYIFHQKYSKSVILWNTILFKFLYFIYKINVLLL